MSLHSIQKKSLYIQSVIGARMLAFLDESRKQSLVLQKATIDELIEVEEAGKADASSKRVKRIDERLEKLAKARKFVAKRLEGFEPDGKFVTLANLLQETGGVVDEVSELHKIAESVAQARVATLAEATMSQHMAPPSAGQHVVDDSPEATAAAMSSEAVAPKAT